MKSGEIFNSVSHLVGALAAIAAIVILVVVAATQGDAWKVVSFSIYGSTLFLLYLISTLYHSLSGKAKSVFRVLDHQAIYILIAGTYTPFTLVTLNGLVGWWLFGAIWAMAVVGLVLDALPQRGRRIIPVVIYLLMGWLVLLALKPLLDALPLVGFLWLLAGGLFYTLGIVFFVYSEKYRYAHGIWHLFVLAGSTCHFFSILFYV